MISNRDAKNIISLHAKWVGISIDRDKNHGGDPWYKHSESCTLYGKLIRYRYKGGIEEFYLDERGIVWGEKDKDKYGMLSNVALTLK